MSEQPPEQRRPQPRMRWWGWGDPEHPPALPAHALDFLRETVGLAERPRPPVALAQVRLEPGRLDEGRLDSLRVAVGGEWVREDHGERVLHAAGKGYPDLVRMRAGEPAGAPDAIVYPGDHEQVLAVLAACAAHSIAVVPFGGGTSVVGGLAPIAGEHAGVVSLDLGRLDQVTGIDRESATVRVGAGIRAPALEHHLAARGLTLGHYPQSYEHVSLGGCAATRSAGQSSTGYGSIEKMVLGLRFAAPTGTIELPPQPASAAGPSMRQLLVGSEGALGVISELALRVRPTPRARVYEGVFFRGFSAGAEALRWMARDHVRPDVARLSDRQETRMSLALAGTGGLKGRLGLAYLGARGYGGEGACLAILGFEGGEEDVAWRRARALDLVRRGGGLPVGQSPGRAWRRGRFEGPYLRDDLLTHGVMVETLETATQWSNVGRAHGAVGAAIEGALRSGGTPGLVMCHISHVYESGCSLYFTFLARQREGEELEQWREVKRAACEAIVASGATITHHHAVGVDHAPWMGAEIGERGVRALRALKEELDPAGVMNPGKLLEA